MIAAIILAAGESSRMGFPKALLEFRGRTFLAAILDATVALGVQRFLVVGEQADKILSGHDLSGVTVLTNDELEAGPIGSIRAGIRGVINHPVEAILVWPVDFPHVTLGTVQALIDRFRESRLPIVVPEFEGQRGHPALFGRAVFEELLRAPNSEGARAVVRADPGRVAQVPVGDAAVVDRLNTPESYRDLLRREDQRGR